MVQRFTGYWGFVVTTQNNTQLACFFTESSRKPHQTNVSPSKQRGRESMKTGCEFVISAANHPQMKKTAKRHRTPVRISSFQLKHGEQCKPGLTEQRMAKKAAGAVFGALDLKELGLIIQINADGNMNTAQIRKMLKSYINNVKRYTKNYQDLRRNK
jgi:hypothetical protein